MSEGEVTNEMVEIEYEYTYAVESLKYENIFSLFGNVFQQTKTAVEYEYEFDHETHMTMFMEGTC